MKNHDKYLIIIGGPTASGKTTLGIQLAQHYDTTILSADSRQFYREMNIGTAKPSPEERQAAPHHFVDNLSIYDTYTVGDYERAALVVLEEIFQQKNIAIMVGGSGFFIKAVCEGLDKFPEIPPNIRHELTQLFENQGIMALQNELQECDPEYFEQVDTQNPKRLMRALEVCRATGKPFSAFHQQTKTPRNFTPIYIGIDWERAILYERINQRVDKMIAQGLEQEAADLQHLRHLTSLQTVGYQEWFAYFDGKIDRNEAIRLIKRNTRRYAKRQLTWCRKIPDMIWVKPQSKTVIQQINQNIATRKTM